MGTDEKKVYMLLKSVIFHYHGLDDDERENLEQTATQLNAKEELNWANKFIAEDYLTSFERAREYLNEYISDYPKPKRIEYIHMVWEANNLKGFVTELEVAAMVKLASDWRVQDELKKVILSNVS
ncbi:MAG: hypothetical protein OEW75_08720 [Cyclobacteriaceae bacterium]|nr:hypothetical protein [Cyclobacteriaceae bacterium]